MARSGGDDLGLERLELSAGIVGSLELRLTVIEADCHGRNRQRRDVIGHDVPVIEIVELGLAEERRRLPQGIREPRGDALEEEAVPASEHDIPILERRPRQPDTRHDVVVVAGHDRLGVGDTEVQPGSAREGSLIEVRGEDEPVLDVPAGQRRGIVEDREQPVLLRREPQ